MRIPENCSRPIKEIQSIEDLWFTTAQQLSMRHGIYIDVGIEYYGVSSVMEIRRIYFKIGDREFEGLIELKRALELKAFL